MSPRWCSAWMALGLALTGLCSMGCNLQPKGGSGSGGDAAAASASAAGAGSGASAQDRKGHLTFKVQPTKNQSLQLLQTMFDGSSYPGGPLTKALDDKIAWPHDVLIQVRDCGVLNAFYNPQDHTVNLCYELAAYFFQYFSKHPLPEGPTAALIEAMTFTQLHEMGHMTIAELDLGAMGNQETDADGFATTLLLDGDAVGKHMARVGAVTMLALLKASGSKPQYFDEHPFSMERFSEILCLVYGSNPSAGADLIAEKLVLVSRAPKCQEEYTNTEKAWDKLLESHKIKP
jgi:hypothetical protein